MHISPIVAMLGALAIPGTVFSQDWSVKFSGINTFSSPRVADLNGDGTGDIIFGAGREEFKKCDSAVIALDGRSGKMLWNVSASDQIFGSADFLDITGDNIKDIFIGGRSASLMAINGKTGKIVWRFTPPRKNKQRWYNFYNPQFIVDQDGDGLKDILISNGGNVLAAPHSEKDRYAGCLVIISSATGDVLARAAMPDNKETYMSVSPLPLSDGVDYKVIFGTGGETVGGNLFLTKLSQIKVGDLSMAQKLDSSVSHGYIGPAAWVDITMDKNPDIIANAVEGKLVAFDGNSLKPLWHVRIPNTEAYSSIATGFFTEDKIPDFFVSYAVGRWPDLEYCKQIMVDGATGKTLFEDSLGSYQTSTAVVIDIDGDERDEVLLSVNIQVYDQHNKPELYTMIISINFASGEIGEIISPVKGSNISSTPWIGDIDNNNLLDIIYCHGTNTKKTYTFDGMQINRISTNIPVRDRILWGSYMGSDYDGVFRVENINR